MVKITRIARAAIRARLADATTGFNPLFAAELADMSITTPANFRLPIVYTDPSKNFFEADLDEADFQTSTPFTWPFQTLFGMDTTNQNRAKFCAFAGLVTLGLNTFVSWPGTRALTHMESVCDGIESALIETFNGQANAEWATTYDARLCYNGGFNIKRSRITRAAESWTQTIYGVMTLEMIDNG